MMIRKKLVVATALTAVAVLTLAGCGRGDDAANAGQAGELTEGAASGTVTIWAQGTEGEALQDFVKTFEDANPDVTVEVTAIPWGDALNKYQTAIAGGTTPDIGMLGTDWMANFGTSLQTVPDALDTSDIFPAAIANAEVNDELVAVPWITETRAVYYRTDLLDATGITEFPTDWAGLHDLAAAYQSSGADYGMSLPTSGWGTFVNLLPYLWSNGGELTNADQTEWTIDTPDNVKSLEYINSFFQDGIANKTPDTEATQANFVSGVAPMLISGPWDIATINEAGGEGMADKYSVAPIPAGPNGESTSFIGGTNLGVFKAAKNSDAAWKLVQWLTSPEVQVEWFKVVTALPSQQSAWEDSVLADDPKVSVFGEQLASTKVPPSVSTWNEVSAAGDTEIEQMIAGGKSPADVAASIQATADSLGFGN